MNLRLETLFRRGAISLFIETTAPVSTIEKGADKYPTMVLAPAAMPRHLPRSSTQYQPQIGPDLLKGLQNYIYSLGCEA